MAPTSLVFSSSQIPSHTLGQMHSGWGRPPQQQQLPPEYPAHGGPLVRSRRYQALAEVVIAEEVAGNPVEAAYARAKAYVMEVQYLLLQGYCPPGPPVDSKASGHTVPARHLRDSAATLNADLAALCARVAEQQNRFAVRQLVHKSKVGNIEVLKKQLPKLEAEV